MSVRCVITDIEGTTTPISFVHDVLFPFSAERLPDFVRRHRDTPAVQACLLGLGVDAAIEQLLQYIKEDRKDPSLKKLQGMIWREGYATGAFVSAVYADVQPSLAAWKACGLRLGVYSSGSVEAQKLLFAHTEVGDLTPLFSDYFDTDIGTKREVASYSAIASRLQVPPATVVFLSDIGDELDAARAAGMRSVQLVRPGTTPADGHVHAATFADVML